MRLLGPHATENVCMKGKIQKGTNSCRSTERLKARMEAAVLLLTATFLVDDALSLTCPNREETAQLAR